MNKTNIITNEAELTLEAINNARNNLDIPESLTVNVYSGYWYWKAIDKNVIGVKFCDVTTGEELAWCDALDEDGNFEMKFGKYQKYQK